MGFDGVGAFASQFDHHIAIFADPVEVIPETTDQIVIAGVAQQGVIAVTAEQGVVAGTTVDQVVAGVAGDGVGGVAASDGLVARADEFDELDVAGGDEALCGAEDGVGAFAGEFGDDVSDAVDQVAVVACTPDQGVGAEAAIDRVVAIPACQHVVAVVAGEAVVEFVAGGLQVAAAAHRQVFDVGAQGEADVGLDRVRAFIGGLDDLVAEIPDTVDIVALPPHHRVGTQVAQQGVVAAAANEGVVASAAVDQVVTSIAGDGVGDGVADNGLITTANQVDLFDFTGNKQVQTGAVDGVGTFAVQFDDHVATVVHDVGVVSGTTNERVSPGSTVEEVVATAALQRVPTRRAHEHVVASEAVQHVIAGETIQHVIACCACQRVIAAGSVQQRQRCQRGQVPGQIGLSQEGDLLDRVRRIGRIIAGVETLDRHGVAGAADRQHQVIAHVVPAHLAGQDIGLEIQQVRPDPIRRATRGGNGVVAIAEAEHIGVVAGASMKHVVASATDHRVVAIATVQRVLSCARADEVIPCQTGQAVGAVRADQCICSGRARAQATQDRGHVPFGSIVEMDECDATAVHVERPVGEEPGLSHVVGGRQEVADRDAVRGAVDADHDPVITQPAQTHPIGRDAGAEVQGVVGIGVSTKVTARHAQDQVLTVALVEAVDVVAQATHDGVVALAARDRVRFCRQACIATGAVVDLSITVDQVVAFITVDQIGPCIADQRVIAGAAAQHVVAAVAEHCVVACATFQGVVVACTGLQEVVTILAVQQVQHGVVATDERVLPRATDQIVSGVGPLAAGDPVVACVAPHVVDSGALDGGQHVVARAAGQFVVAQATGQDIVAVLTPELVRRVLFLATTEGVLAGPAPHPVAAMISPDELVIAFFPHQIVAGCGATDQQVVTETAEQLVAALLRFGAPAPQRVVAITALQFVVTRHPVDHVIAAVADNHVVQFVAGACQVIGPCERQAFNVRR